MISKSIDEITFLTYSVVLINNLQDGSKQDSQQQWILDKIRRKGKHFNICVIYKVERDQVQQAHDLAKESSTTGSRIQEFPLKPD